MQNYYKTIGAMLAASALVAGNASAEVEYEIHTGYTSEYLFRGIDLGNDLVETGVDVTTEFSGLSLSAGAWYGSFDASGPGVNDGDELDLYGGNGLILRRCLEAADCRADYVAALGRVSAGARAAVAEGWGA